MSEAALALEARSSQGQAIRLRFDRAYFHRRAENYQEWKLLTAWRDQLLVGIAGAALKAATFEGREVVAGYFFDVRVAPEERRTRLAKQLIDAFTDWVTDRMDLTYGYVVGDNAAAQQLASRIFGNSVSPAFRCLVYPILRARSRPIGFARAEGGEVHRRYLDAAGPFDLYCNPQPLFGSDPHVGSWLFDGKNGRAGASAWSNKDIMAEVVDRLPLPLSAAGAVLRLPIVRRLPLPQVPRRGEAIRSWYVF
jgi:GNAT superfamily N-acetyltransferase